MNETRDNKELVSKASGFGKSLEGEQKWPPVMYKMPVRMVSIDLAIEQTAEAVAIKHETNIP